MIGTRLGTYEIVEEVGRGGMAAVYRAYHRAMDRWVAVKVLHGTFAQEEDARVRFGREARLMARLEHPHLLPIFDFDPDHEPPYLVTRLLEGGSLRDALRLGPLPPQEAAFLLDQVASALDFAHRKGVLHRDIKPSNILLDLDGNAYLTDFGLARRGTAGDRGGGLTLPGAILGTPTYMAPEQAMGGGGMDFRADVYALGAVLFEMLTGSPPFPGDSAIAVAVAHMNAPVPSARQAVPQLPEAVDGVLGRALAKSPRDRFLSAADLSRAAEAALGHLATRAPVALSRAARQYGRSRVGGGSEGHRTTPTPGAARGGAEGHRPRPGSSEQMGLVVALVATFSEWLEPMEAEGGEEGRQEAARIRTLLGATAAAFGASVEGPAGNTLLAVWGLDGVLPEGAPANSVRAALALAGKARAASGEDPPPLEAGIAAGPALLSIREESSRTTASGPVLSLASRLAGAAPPGSVLLSPDALRLVRGLFDLAEGPSLQIRGRPAPVASYRVLGEKPTHLRLPSPTFDGLATRTVGREREEAALREAFEAVASGSGPRVVALLGEAGIGKSRLLADLLHHVDLRAEPAWFFLGRAQPEAARKPLALFSDLLSNRFGSAMEDPGAPWRDRVRKGLGPFFPETGGEPDEELVDVLAGLAGAPNSDVAPSEWGRRAVEGLTRFFWRASRIHPVLLALEDFHGCDALSLEVLRVLLTREGPLPVVAVCLARPSLYARFPAWSEGLPGFSQWVLEPLGEAEARALVRDLLQRVPDLPTPMVEGLVRRAEGNPLFLEELVRTLLEEGAIVRGDSEWRVDASRLAGGSLPTSLLGLLKARLDPLSPGERVVLQRAAAVGRVFWTGAVDHLAQADGLSPDLGRALHSLEVRGVVRPHPASALPDSAEFSFASPLFREAVLDTVPRRLLRAYHSGAADWLAARSPLGDPDFEWRLAEHLEHGGRGSEAAARYLRAGERLLAEGSAAEALSVLERAARLSPEGSLAAAARLRVAEAKLSAGDPAGAGPSLDAVLAWA
ncbi:MAG: protein kinase, partial [Acidobacteriota bacterium]